MLTLPMKTRHLDVSNVQVALALVLQDGLDPFQDLLGDIGRDDHADIVVEQHVLLRVACSFVPANLRDGVESSVHVRGLPGAAHLVASGPHQSVDLPVLLDVGIVGSDEVFAAGVRDEYGISRKFVGVDDVVCGRAVYGDADLHNLNRRGDHLLHVAFFLETSDDLIDV